MALGFQIFQALDGLTNGFPVGQHAAQPAVVNIELVATLSGFFYGFRRGTLGTYKQDLALLGSYGAMKFMASSNIGTVFSKLMM